MRGTHVILYGINSCSLAAATAAADNDATVAGLAGFCVRAYIWMMMV